MNKVTVIIPVKNEEIGLINCVKSINDNKVDCFFIIVDDNSSDSTVDNIKLLFEQESINGLVIINDNQQGKGAGACRNIGLKHIPSDSDFVLFYDADDEMPSGALDKMVHRIVDTGAEVCVGQYSYYVSRDATIGMNKSDKHLWHTIEKRCHQDVFSAKDYPFFLKTINYPWNKLISYNFLQSLDLKFSTTPVHNDILGHWIILSNADKITLLKECVCRHYVIAGNEQITNVSDEKRLAIFSVLEELESYLRSNGEYHNNYYHIFLSFKKEVMRWAYNKLSNEHKNAAIPLIKESYRNISSQEVLKASLFDTDAVILAAASKLGFHYETINDLY
jgi:glycosyltransferase involved in cell wall biosynthesis